MKPSNILIVLIFFTLGITAEYFLDIHWVILITIWTGLLLLTLVYSFFKKYNFQFRKIRTVHLLVVCFCTGMLNFSFTTSNFHDHQYDSFFLTGDEITAKITEYEHRSGAYDKAILSIKTVIKSYKNIDVNGKLLAYIKADKSDSLAAGQIIQCKPQIVPIENANNPGEFDAERFWKMKGIENIVFLQADNIVVHDTETSFFQFWERTRNRLINIIESHISKENQGLAIALTMGDKSQLSMESKEHFKDAGAMHVLAVSGMHVGILLGIIQFIFFQIPFLRKRNLYIYVGIVLLWCFAFLTGMSPSVVRAVAMFTILAVGQLLGKRYFSLHAVFASALILLIFNPLYLFDVGFQLSYAAVIGIALFYREIAGIFYFKQKIFNYFWQGTALGIAAQIGTIPMSLYYFHQFPNYFMITNIGVLVFASIAMISVVFFLLFSWVPLLNDGLAFIVDFVYTSFSQFISWINQLPAVISTGFTPSLLMISSLYLSGILFYYYWKNKRLKGVKITALFIFLLFTGVLIQREINQVQEEFIVFNYHRPIIAFQTNRTLYCFYDEEDNISSKNSGFLLQGIETQRGVKAIVQSLAPQTVTQLSPEIKIEHTRDKFSIQYYDKEYIIAKSNRKPEVRSYDKIIFGSWNQLDEKHPAPKMSSLQQAFRVKK